MNHKLTRWMTVAAVAIAGATPLVTLRVQADDAAPNTEVAEVDQLKTPYFFPMGSGGVDFVGLKAYLDSIQWRGFLNVELDTSPWRPPIESARITANYIESVLKIPL